MRVTYIDDEQPEEGTQTESPMTGPVDSELVEYSRISDINSAESEVVKLAFGLVSTHPLHYRWVLWTQDMGTNNLVTTLKRTPILHPLGCFDTVETFLDLFRTIPSLSQLSPGSAYFLFKEGIEPSLEHEANKGGGCWVRNVYKRTKQLDYWWQAALKAVLGSEFGDNEEAICGVVASVSFDDKDTIALWLNDANDVKAVHELGEVYKSKMLLVPGLNSTNVFFKCHPQSSRRAL